MNGRDRRKLASRVKVRILLTSLLFASPSFGQTAENRNVADRRCSGNQQVSRVFGTGADDTVIADGEMPTQTAGQ